MHFIGFALGVLFACSFERTECLKDCNAGWQRFQDNCYYFSSDTKTWFEADKVCKLQKGHLARIENKDENEYLKSLARSHKAGPAWVDLTDEGTEGTWRYSSNQKPLKFKDWGSRQPDNGKIANCGALFKDFDYKWDDYICGNARQYICEKELNTTLEDEDECSFEDMLLEKIVALKKKCRCG